MDAPVSETEEAKVVYESDLRAGAHSNGWTPNLVEPKVTGGGSDIPPELPEEPEYHKPEKPGEQNRVLAYTLAFIYIGAACLSAYVGITMIRDLNKKEKK